MRVVPSPPQVGTGRGNEGLGVDDMSSTDGDLARLERIWDLSLKVDVKKAVFEVCTFDEDVICKLEGPFELTGCNASVEELDAFLIRR